jgi:hypothetical protein
MAIHDRRGDRAAAGAARDAAQDAMAEAVELSVGRLSPFETRVQPADSMLAVSWQPNPIRHRSPGQSGPSRLQESGLGRSRTGSTNRDRLPPGGGVGRHTRQRWTEAVDSPPRHGHAPGMPTRRVSWRRTDDVRADEHCTISTRDAGLSLVGTVLGAEGGLPVRIEYRVFADGKGATTAVHVRDLRGFAQRTLALTRSPKGGWTVDGVAHRDLKACVDVDLGCSPSTNTLPIRRLRLGVGTSTTIQVAWVRFPELTVHKVAQMYARLDEFTYRYSSGDFEAELVVDEDGVVARYGPWERTGVAAGIDDTEPLDAR